MPRYFLTHGHKLAILRDVDERTSNGESLRAVARSHGVQPVQIRNWRKTREKLQDAPKSQKAMSRGRTSTIKHLEEYIIGWAMDMKCNGHDISYRHLQLKAASIDDNFRNRTNRSQYQIIRRLCAANCLVRHRKTHQAKEHHQAT